MCHIIIAQSHKEKVLMVAKRNNKIRSCVIEEGSQA